MATGHLYVPDRNDGTNDWMDAASSNELFGLEPKWLRITDTFAIEMMKTTEWTEAAEDKQRAIQQNDRVRRIVETELLRLSNRLHASRALWDILPTWDAGCFGAYRETAGLQNFVDVDVGGQHVHENCHKDRPHRSGNITLCHSDTPKLQDTKEEDDKTDDQCDMLANKFVGKRRFVHSDANVNWENENNIEKTETLWLYGAAATRGNLPGVETGILCHSAVGHETNSDKTINVEFRKDSGRVGPLESFKNDFKNWLFFPVPQTEWWGGRTLTETNKNRMETKNQFFGPFSSSSTKP